jgi:hypothetical protein
MYAMDCKLGLVLAALVGLTAVGCGKAPNDSASSGNIGAAGIATGSSLESLALPEWSSGSGGPATWSNLPSGRAWTATTLSEVAANLSSFEKAADRETYCPGYSQASLVQRETCWVRLISAVAQFESDFDPMNKYHETNGAYSVGLLQLSTGECGIAGSVTELEDPIKNLQCGTRKMAALIARYGYITSPDNLHGAAAYWSTLRRPYVSGSHHLGKALEVQRITKKFLAVDPAETAAGGKLALSE